jgi:serine protease Do
MKRNAVAWVALVVSTAALVSSRGLTRPVPAAPEIPAEAQKTAKALSQAFEAVADFVKPSVVQINIERRVGARSSTPGRNLPFRGTPPGTMPKDLEDLLKRFLEPGGQFEQEQFSFKTEGTGSGFVYDDKGHILTNHHVVEGANKITVTFFDGVEVPAKVVGTDEATDVAVIRVDNTRYRPVVKGDSNKLKVGELVMAIGSPFNLSQSVTAGIVSATERNNVQINEYEAFIQTDAAVNPGNSGGPLVDMDGRVVGINAAIATSTRANAGVGFSIPIALASGIADKLIKDGKINYARIGVTIQPMTPALAEQFGVDPKTRGVLVNTVVPDSPAEKAGLQPGDVITSFNDEPVLSAPSFRMRVATSDVGKTFRLSYVRNGKPHEASVVLASATEVESRLAGRDRPQRGGRSQAPRATVNEYGLGVQDLTPELASQFGYPEDTQGLVVTSVKEGSPAEAAGLETGDLITRVVKDHRPQPVPNLKSFQDLASQSEKLTVFVKSAKNPGQFVTLSKDKK